MELHTNNVDQFIKHCIRKAREDTHPTYNHSSETSSEEDHNSFLIHYMDTNDISSNTLQSMASGEISSLDTPSLCSIESNDIESDTECMDDNFTVSLTSTTSSNDRSTCGTSLNGDMIPKSFLQLSGITLGNYNMGCSFHISTALWILIQYNISILAIQEHTAWNRNLLQHELTSTERHCNKWGYFATISKLQIIIIDKQLLASHSETLAFHEGHIIQCRFQIGISIINDTGISLDHALVISKIDLGTDKFEISKEHEKEEL